MGHQVIKLQNPLKTLGFLQFYRFKTVKDRIIIQTSVLVKPCRRKFLREAADRRSAMVQTQRKNSHKVPPIGGALRKPVRFCAGANTG